MRLTSHYLLATLGLLVALSASPAQAGGKGKFNVSSGGMKQSRSLSSNAMKVNVSPKPMISSNAARFTSKPKLQVGNNLSSNVGKVSQKNLGNLLNTPVKVAPRKNGLPNVKISDGIRKHSPIINAGDLGVLTPGKGPIFGPGKGPIPNPVKPIINPPGGPLVDTGKGPIFNPGKGPIFNPNNPIINRPGGPLVDTGKGPIFVPGKGPIFDPVKPIIDPPSGPILDPGKGPIFDPGKGPIFDPDNPIINPPGGPIVDPGNDNPPADPGNPPADPGNPPGDPGQPPADPGNPPVDPDCPPHCPPNNNCGGGWGFPIPFPTWCGGYYGGYNGGYCGTTTVVQPVYTQVTPAAAVQPTVQAIDLELVEVRQLDRGDLANGQGPAFRVTVRNKTGEVVHVPFTVALAASIGRVPAADSAFAASRVNGLEAVQSLAVDVRLPATAFKLGVNADGQPVAYTWLTAVVDSHMEVEQADRKNDLATMNRSEVVMVALQQ